MTYREKRQLLIIILTVFAINFGCEWAAYYNTSGPLNTRAQIVPLFGTLAGLCAVSRSLRRPTYANH